MVINSPRDADEYTGTAPSLNGMSQLIQAAEAMVAWLEREGAGEGRVSYRLGTGALASATGGVPYRL